MILFATPDFGASAGIGCFLLFVWAVVLVLVILGLIRGGKLLGSTSCTKRRYGIAFLLLSALLPLSCWLGPSVYVRLAYGNYPLGKNPGNKIEVGMTADEVLETLGTPHTRDEDRWYYWIDSFGLNWFRVDFGQDQRVIGTHSN
jgi:hypothetical protein